MAKLGPDTITVIRKTKVDRLSDATPGAAPESKIEGCMVIPRSSYETGRGWVTVEGRMVAAPYGSDILSTDEIRLDDGSVWQIEGTPGHFRKRSGIGKATIAYLTQTKTA